MTVDYPTTCPLCGVSLIGDLIPERSREFYGNATHFSQVVSVYSLRQDRIVAWACPACDGQWPRDG